MRILLPPQSKVLSLWLMLLLIYLEAMRDGAVSSGADIMSAGRDVQRAACAVVKNYWHSFGYNYVLTTIHTKHEKVLAYL
jgi:hypothetical protein